MKDCAVCEGSGVLFRVQTPGEKAEDIKRAEDEGKFMFARLLRVSSISTMSLRCSVCDGHGALPGG